MPARSALLKLPVSAYPPIAPPQIGITASYPGASAEVVEKTVTSVIEQQLTGVDNLIYFDSTSRSNGQSQIALTFLNGTHPDIAAVQVQNRLSVAQPRLPQEVVQNGIVVAKANADFLMVVALQSSDPAIDSYALDNLISAQVLDPIRRLPGVGGAGSGYAMRIRLDPERLPGFQLGAADALNAVRAQNVQIAAGSIGAEPGLPGQGFTASVSAAARFTSVDELGAIILRTNPDGSQVRLRDVARIGLGSESYGRSVRLEGKPIAGFAIQLASDANALDVAAAVRTRMDALLPYLPSGVGWVTPYDSTQFIHISIEEVVVTLFEAIVLVFLVILLFLQNLRASIIPTLVVPVALTGAFAGMYPAGFSINVLTLFGLVLAIGLAVDDAIVVVENVERIMTEEGLPPKEAARKAMDRITGAVIAMTLVLAAVFIPMAMVSGSVGAIYRQFALTIAISMGVSALMALSFTPALCATLLKGHRGRPNWFLRRFNVFCSWMARAYLARAAGAVRRKWLWMLVYAGLVGLAVYLLVRLPTSFLPPGGPGLCLRHSPAPARGQFRAHRGRAARDGGDPEDESRGGPGAGRGRVQLRGSRGEPWARLHPVEGLGPGPAGHRPFQLFLALAALYESRSVPVAAMLVVPLGVLGALSFTWLRGLENDAYFKVGLIAVIGLPAKNAILIVEFANSLRLAGHGLVESTLDACRLRFRPILMTSIAFILGVLPLAISTGAGANSRHAIGTGVMGGMVGATLLGVLFVPVFHVVVRRLIGDRGEGRAPRAADPPPPSSLP